MKAVIIDDNVNSCHDLRSRLAAHDIDVVGEAYNGFDGLDLVNDAKPDVLFIDVELPDISGLDFISRSTYLKESDCRIVIYTAYDKYVLPALRQRVQDVLLKPVDDEELEGIVTRLRASTPPRTSSLSQEVTSPDPRYVLFTNSVDFTIIGKGDVCLFQYDASSRCWEAVVAGQDHPVRLKRSVRRDSLFKLGGQYVQVHQKYIVNVDYLLSVVDNVCHFFPPFENIDYVAVGRVYREKLLAKFLSL